MREVLVLYPGPARFREEQVRAHRPVLDALGIRLVLANDVILPSDRELFADVLELPPAEHVRAGWKRLEGWLANRRVDAVFAQSESSLPLGALAAQALGLPGHAPRVAVLTLDKHACRVRLERAGVPQPAFALARTAADVRAFARQHGYPVVMKGVASALARLVTRVDDEQAVEDRVARLLAALPRSADVQRLVEFTEAGGLEPSCLPQAEFLVESFARGVPVETDGLVVGDSNRSFGVTEQVLSRSPEFYMEGYLHPAPRPLADLVAIERTSDAALRALGLGNSAYSIEMRLEDRVARIIEVNGRLGWDEGFGDLFAERIGAQPVFLALQLALGVPVSFESRAEVHAAVAYRSSYVDGVVTRLPDPDELAAAGDTHRARIGLAVELDERMYAPPHPEISPHLAWALATDPSSSRTAYERARAAVEALSIGVTV